MTAMTSSSRPPRMLRLASTAPRPPVTGIADRCTSWRARGSGPPRSAPRGAGLVGAVAPVAGLGQAVGAEGGVLLRGHEVVDPAVVGDGVEVMDDPAALVADVLVVLETEGTAHGSDNSSGVPGPPAPSAPRTRNSPRGMLTLGLLTAFDPCSARADPAARPSVSLTLPVRRRSL